ncbi:MAG: NAD(P)-binding protein, partial [Methyloglobulus sp.]
MQTDFLIIGQGLAGSLLAWALMQRGCKVVVVDTG